MDRVLRLLCLLFVCLVVTTSRAQSSGSFKVTQDWGSGFQGEITIKNLGSTAIKDWTLQFDFARNISSIWDARLITTSGNTKTVSNAGWNADIPAGGSVSFGFVGDPGNVTDAPTNYRVTSGSGGNGGGGTGGGGGGSGTGTEGSGAPAKPTLAIKVEGNQMIAEWNLYYGNNATYWDLRENDIRIADGKITPNAPQPQSVRVTLPAREYAANRYQIILQNSKGKTKSDPISFTFGGASRIVAKPIDGTAQATQVSVPLGQSTVLNLTTLGVSKGAYRVFTNHPAAVSASISSSQLTLIGLKTGRASLRIEETTSGQTRYLGVKVLTATGGMPPLPALGVGSVSEDTPADLTFWRDFTNPDRNKHVDVRYIYLNGGPFNGWRTWSSVDGGRVISFIRESQKLGFVPYFVWYNIPDGGESYWVDREHISDRTYLRAYFRDLKFTTDLIRKYSPNDPVGMILEPDFLGYMMQNAGARPNQIPAVVSAAYDEGVLTRGVDPAFPETVTGLVSAINYIIHRNAPSARFGWQFNLWASPGIKTTIGARGLMRITDTQGITLGRANIQAETREITKYYKEAGILSHGAQQVSIDKYGLDAGAENGAALNPANSTWFWNLDHWNNYLLFARTLREETGVPVTLWQLPVGRINSTLAISPYSGSRFPNLTNLNQKYEDSAPTFFLGDRFTVTGARKAWFTTNLGGDPGISVTGDIVEWRPHLDAARAAGIDLILFGAGVGDSTDGVGSPPTDDYWWITRVQACFPSR